MGLTYRLIKGAPLTIEEVDQNFMDLDQRLSHLEQAQKPCETIAQVKQENDILFFIGTQGSVLGQAQIPRAPFQPKGAWSPKTAYHVGDAVYHQKQLFLCQKSATKEDFDPQDWALLLTL